MSLSAVGQIVQPIGTVDIRSAKNLADLFGVLVLMVPHVDALVGVDVEDLDLPGVVRHDVLERLFDSAQTLIDATGNLDSPSQWDLKVRGGFDRPSLEQVVGAHADFVTFVER